MTASSPIAPPPTTDPLGWEDDDEYALRQQLGLRPVVYRERGGHPDNRPCPAWCSNALKDEPHSVTESFPTQAWHSSPIIETLSDVYAGGAYADKDGDKVITGAVIDTWLVQRGAGPTFLKVQFGASSKPYQLTLDDARDLLKAMAHLVGRAESVDLLEQVQR